MEKKQTVDAVDKNHSDVESRAIYSAFVGGGLGFLLGIPLFMSNSISLFERGLSVGYAGSIVGAFVALITYLIATSSQEKISKKTKTRWQEAKDYVATWSIALVHSLLIFLTYALLFYVISEAFKDALIDRWSASAILALSTGFASYVVYLSARTMTAVRVSMLLALFLLSGTFLSMMTASDPHWWDVHFSSLGAGGGVSGYAFNLTLIIAGIVIVALTRYITDDFKNLQHKGKISKKARVGILRILLAGVGLGLAGVGLFVYNEFPTIHNTSAGGMAFLFIGVVALLPVLTPGFTKAFFVASYLLLTALFVSVWLFLGVNYLNLTVFELLAAAIIFTWLVVFVRHLSALLSDESKEVKA